MKRWAIALTVAALIAALSLPLTGCVTSRTAPGPSASSGARQYTPAVVRENAGGTSPAWMRSSIDCSDSFDEFDQNFFDTIIGDEVSPQESLDVLNNIYILGFIRNRHIYRELPRDPGIRPEALRLSLFKDLYAICKTNKGISLNDIMYIKNWAIKEFPHYHQEYVDDFEQGIRESLAITMEREHKNKPITIPNRQRSKAGR